MNAVVMAMVAGAPIALHATWRARFGYPPDDVPRVLCFHKISRQFCWEGTWTTPARFAAYLDRLRARGYTFIDESRYLAALEARAPGTSRQVLLTFDDGYDDVYDLAWPILAERGIPFHVFVVSDYAGKTNDWDLSLGRRPFRHMGWNRVREMAARGVTFGSHTASHRDVTRLAPAELREDLARSKRNIEDGTGMPVRTLSYPFGRYHDAAARVVRETGFDAAFSLYPSRRNATVDRYALRREGVYIIDPVSLIERKLEKNWLYGLEEMKCRAINAVAVLTPLLKNRRDGGG
jgi:peptidoglycan/xylan/chitin deacetylase (PgdA/CDA1 family)